MFAGVCLHSRAFQENSLLSRGGSIATELVCSCTRLSNVAKLRSVDSEGGSADIPRKPGALLSKSRSGCLSPGKQTKSVGLRFGICAASEQRFLSAGFDGCSMALRQRV